MVDGQHDTTINIGGPINRDTPIAEWFISWKILLKWMRTGGTSILGNPQITFVSLEGKSTAKPETFFVGKTMNFLMCPVKIFPPIH